MAFLFYYYFTKRICLNKVIWVSTLKSRKKRPRSINIVLKIQRSMIANIFRAHPRPFENMIEQFSTCYSMHTEKWEQECRKVTIMFDWGSHYLLWLRVDEKLAVMLERWLVIITGLSALIKGRKFSWNCWV